MEVAKQKAISGEMNEFDEQMMTAIAKMKEKYKEHTNRRSIVVITQEQVRNIKREPVTTNKPKKEKKEKVPAATSGVVICDATKMNGEKCTAKAKPGCKFCGRHMPK